jgi:hypothetical protein
MGWRHLEATLARYLMSKRQSQGAKGEQRDSNKTVRKWVVRKPPGRGVSCPSSAHLYSSDTGNQTITQWQLRVYVANATEITIKQTHTENNNPILFWICNPWLWFSGNTRSMSSHQNSVNLWKPLWNMISSNNKLYVLDVQTKYRNHHTE